MDLSTLRQPDAPRETLVELLERDPGRFEPVTAFRVAQSAIGDEDSYLDIASHTGVSPAPLPIGGFRHKGKHASLRSAFAGLTGPLGSMPAAYDELILREERNKSGGLARFFDLFSARMAELFADAAEKYRIARRLRWGQRREDNGFIKALSALTGFGTRKLQEKNGVDEDAILRFSGFFAARNRNAVNLRAIVGEYSGLPVEIELFRGRWLTIQEHERSRMGSPQGAQLGVNATAGSAIHDFSGGFRIVVGPVAYKDYLRLAPGGAEITKIFDLARLYVGSALDFDIQVILRREDIPFCRLGSDSVDGLPRLGWNSWARVAPAKADSGDAVIVQRWPAESAGGEHAT